MILIADDEKLNRKLLQWSLDKLGLGFVHAENGFEAIERVKEGGIQVILLDLMMPELDGFEFLQWRANAGEEIRQIPVIVNSALSDVESIKNALTLGAYDFFSKPLSSDALEVLLPTKVRNAIERSKANIALRRREEELKKEISIARRFQMSMLPKKDGFGSLGVDYIYKPSSAIGGDFLDLFQIEPHLVAMFIGDVIGHGLKAGMMSAMVKSLFREFVLRDPNPMVLIDSMNKSLIQVFEEGHFVTGIYGLFDLKNQTFTYANCAHPRLFYLDSEQKIVQARSGGHFLGLLDSIIIDIDSLDFHDGNRLFLFTDGLAEARNLDGEELDDEGLKRFLEEEKNTEADQWCSGVFQKASLFHASNEFLDDILMAAFWNREGDVG